VLPKVTSADSYWSMKRAARESVRAGTAVASYEPIEMPRNTPTGFITAFFAVVTGFAVIWHIWWLVIVGLIGAYATFVVFAWRDVHEIEIPLADIERIDRANRRARDAVLQSEGAA
jgi:cytochrome o ubiquinol oxidase subunit 1